MSHFAKIENGIVTQVIVANDDFVVSEKIGDQVVWKQTSYNTHGNVHYGPDGMPDGGTALRGNYAGIGYIYDSVNDVFYAPRPLDIHGLPCTKWTIGAPNWEWNPPIPCPILSPDQNPPIYYGWDDAANAWVPLNSVGE